MRALVSVMVGTPFNYPIALTGWIVKENGIIGQWKVSRNFEVETTLSFGYPNLGSPDVSNGYLR